VHARRSEPQGQVVTVLMPYTCAGCGTTSAHNVDVAAHYDVLKFATAPSCAVRTAARDAVPRRRDGDDAAADDAAPDLGPSS